MTLADELREASDLLDAVYDDVAPGADVWDHAWPIMVLAQQCNPEVVAFVRLMSPAFALAVADWLSAEARRWDDEITTTIPDCPSCGSDPTCDHGQEDHHDGGHMAVGCDRVYGDAEDPCTCWDHALAVARALKTNGAST
jgi:hypothetical protein